MQFIRKLFLSLFASLIVSTAFAQSDSTSISINASYTADNFGVFHGGIKRGYNYLGLAQFHISFDAEKADWWQGGEFYLNASNTHGGTPSETMVGDLQTISNIEAGEHTYLQEFWYKHKFKKFEIILGLQDLNEELANFDLGDLYIHSSFGILPIIAMNVEAPIFPLTSPGITTKWNISEHTIWLNALYKGTPNDFEINPYNLKWNYNKGDGTLFVSEMQQKITFEGKSGTLKFGFFSHSHLADKFIYKMPTEQLGHHTAGIFASYDQVFYERDNRSIAAFLQTGYSPTKDSSNDFYLGLGANMSGCFSKGGDDQLGIALAFDKLNGFGHESFIELTWKKPFSERYFIQPDVQYIIKPGGSNSPIKNALVGIVRFGFEI